MREKAREEKGERERFSQEAGTGVPLARPYAVRVGGTVKAGDGFHRIPGERAGCMSGPLQGWRTQNHPL